MNYEEWEEVKAADLKVGDVICIDFTSSEGVHTEYKKIIVLFTGATILTLMAREGGGVVHVRHDLPTIHFIKRRARNYKLVSELVAGDKVFRNTWLMDVVELVPIRRQSHRVLVLESEKGALQAVALLADRKLARVDKDTYQA